MLEDRFHTQLNYKSSKLLINYRYNLIQLSDIVP